MTSQLKGTVFESWLLRTKPVGENDPAESAFAP